MDDFKILQILSADNVGKEFGRQEAEGQQNLVKSQTLPKEGDWETLERWGVRRCGDADDLFYFCELPEGWEKRAMPHSMGSKLLDQNGLIRAEIFYKAAVYDRTASISVNASRYYVRFDYSGYSVNGGMGHEIRDAATGEVVDRTGMGFYAVLIESPQVVGFLYKETFYCDEIREEYGKERFTRQMSGELARPISDKEFYKQFHHVKRRHELINAADNLTRSIAESLAEKLNQSAEW